jgi:hypothetical protein
MAASYWQPLFLGPSEPLEIIMPRLFPRPRSPFLLVALVIACGSGGDSTAPDNPPADDPPAGSNLPAELLGEWHYQFLGIPKCDPNTGQCASTANQSETLKLSSDGRFEHVFVGESNFPPCRLEGLHQSEGTAEVQGSSLLLHISEGTTRQTDTCGESKTTNEAGQTDTYTWELSDSSGAPQLTLTDAQGTVLGPFDKRQ